MYQIWDLRMFFRTLCGSFRMVFWFGVFWPQFVTFFFSWFSYYYVVWVPFDFKFLLWFILLSLAIWFKYFSPLLFFLLYKFHNFPPSIWLTFDHRFGGEKVDVQLGHLRCVLKSLSSWNTYWSIFLNVLNINLKIMNNTLSDMAGL